MESSVLSKDKRFCACECGQELEKKYDWYTPKFINGHNLRITHPSKEVHRKAGILRSGENNCNWKGDNVGYVALHLWIRSRLPEPELCQDCKSNPPHDLANITGIYNRDFKNWKYLCRRCHAARDLKKIKEN